MSIATGKHYIEDHNVEVFRIILQSLKIKCYLRNGGISLVGVVRHVEEELKVDECSLQDLYFKKLCQNALKRCVSLGFATFSHGKYLFNCLPSRTPPVSCYMHQQYPSNWPVKRKCCPSPSFRPPRCIPAPCICDLGLHCPCLKTQHTVRVSTTTCYQNNVTPSTSTSTAQPVLTAAALKHTPILPSTSSAQPVLSAAPKRTSISKIPVRRRKSRGGVTKRQVGVPKPSRIPKPIPGLGPSRPPTPKPAINLRTSDKPSKIPQKIRSNVCTMSNSNNVSGVKSKLSTTYRPNVKTSRIPIISKR